MQHQPGPRDRPVTLRLAGGIALLTLALAACGGDAVPGAADSGAGGQSAAAGDAPAAGGSAVTYDASLRDSPCSLIGPEVVAAVFDLPVDGIKQYAAGGMCKYDWKGDGRIMNAVIHVLRVGETAAETAGYFANATAGMDAAALDAALESIREQASDEPAAGALLGAAGEVSRAGSGGLEFGDVEGIGDRARMQLGNGDLSVLHGNLYFSVAAFHGDRMQAPASLSEMVSASRAWHRETLSQRKEQSIALAKAALAAR